jgi:SAM-dependent methyltransferase
MTLAAPAHPFDAAAAGYDAAFTDRLLGRWLRAIVWQRLEENFSAGQRVLELGCGTGEDAVWLARRGISVTATDVSAAMLERTRHKAEQAGVGERVITRHLDLASLAHAEAAWTKQTCGFDGAFSNFGPLNCVEDRRGLADGLAGIVRPGGRVVLVVMGPLCPWEIAWHLLGGKPRAAFRRLRSGKQARVGEGGTLRVWYPSHRRLAREFAPYFRNVEVAGVGLLLPPSEMGRLVERAPRFFRRLAELDRRLAGRVPWRWLNDHYLLVLERR